MSQQDVAQGIIAYNAERWVFRPADAPEGEQALSSAVVADVETFANRYGGRDEFVDGRLNAVVERQASEGDWKVVGWRCMSLSSDCGLLSETAWSMHGTEPFWGLSAKGEAWTWTLADPRRRVELELSRTEGPNGPFWLAPVDGGEPWKVTLTPRLCDDGMADAAWHYDVVLHAKGKNEFEYVGCAQRGGNPSP